MASTPSSVASPTSPLSPKRGPPKDINMTVTRIDGKETSTFTMKCTKKITIASIKDRVSGEWTIPQDEQVIVFRGQVVHGDDRAMPLNTPDLAEIVKEAGAKGLQMSVMYKPRRLKAFLRKEGFEEVNDKRTTLATSLHRAVRRSNLSVMEEILEAEFREADARDNAGQTALHVAASTWNRQACEILLRSEKFSASDALDEENRSALHIAASWGDARVIKMILEHWNIGWKDIIPKDVLGNTAFDYAEACGHTEAAELIQKMTEEKRFYQKKRVKRILAASEEAS